MARVPYSGVPEIGPQGGQIPQARLAVPGDAFGSGIGAALGDLGRVLDRAGGELFQRAEALQKLRNDTEAKEADATYMMEVGKLHAEYNSLQGKAAVDAYPGYIENLKKLREDVKGGLSNPESQRLFDSSSRQTMARTVFNGAGHAASQNKRWALGTSEARIKSYNDQALASPDNERDFEAARKNVIAEVVQQGQLMGWSDDQTRQAAVERMNDLWANRIQGIAKVAPVAAKKMFDEAVKSGQIRGEKMTQVDNFVRQQLYTTGARNISHEISTGKDLYFGSKVVPIERAMEAVGGFESGGNYSIQGIEVFDKKTGASRGRALGKYQVMPENLPAWLAEAGLPSMTPAEFLRDKKAQDQLFKVVFGNAMAKYGNFNDAASWWFTGKPMAKAGDVRDGLGTDVPKYLRETNAILARDTPLADRVARGREVSEQISPENPLLADYVETRIQADFGQDQRIKSNTQFQHRMTIETAMMGDAQGKIPTTVDELFAIDPKIQEAWAGLQPDKQRSYMKALAQNAKGDRAWTETNLREYQRLKGLAQVDPAKFLDEDMVSADLPMAARKEFVNLQMKLKAKAEQDPRVTRALKILGSDLKSAGLTKAQDEAGYLRFVGQLQDALTDWSAETQKQPTPQDVQVIGARLLRETATGRPGWIGAATFGLIDTREKAPLYNWPVPEADAARIKNDPIWTARGIEPTDDQIQRLYVREQYQKLYGGTAKLPQVPQSR